MEKPKRTYNKHKDGYKVSVRHFLRKDKALSNKSFRSKLKELLDSKATSTHGEHKTNDVDSETSLFPIYISVSFLQQTVNIRSRLSVGLSEEDFDEYMFQSEVKLFTENESLAIQKSVEDFKPQLRKDFKISEWTEFYGKNTQRMKDFVSDQISDKLLGEIINEYSLTRQEVDMSGLTFLFADVRSLPILHKIQLPIVVKYFDSYRALTNIEALEDANPLPTTLSVSDWYTGYYQSLMQRLHGEESVPLLSSIERLFLS